MRSSSLCGPGSVSQSLLAVSTQAFGTQRRARALGLIHESGYRTHVGIVSSRSVRVTPSNVALPPVWILGSSGETATLAAALGTGYSFASHFSATSPLPAILSYRDTFQPSVQFPRPHVILGVGVVCAETDEKAAWLTSSMELVWVRLHRGEFGQIPSPQEALAYPYSRQERAIVDARRALQVVGSPATVLARTEIVRESGADELMIATATYDATARLRAYELVGEAFGMSVVSRLHGGGTASPVGEDRETAAFQ
ncbi:MAG TPA: LLM class flavin-dependent oxidoreductase [Thermoanaerobaculia bacterium]|nr:LLM class flavin-dependent oxidoreductase [Thermoanaerobaculia bacterium]